MPDVATTLAGVVARNPFAVVGFAISGFCSFVLYKSLNSALIWETTLKSLSVITIGEIIRRLKNGSGPVRAAVLGELEAEGKPLNVEGKDVVAWQRQVFQHRATKRGSKKSLLSSKKGQCNVLLKDSDGSATVEGTNWTFPYQVANTNFQPHTTNLLTAVTASLGGETILGLETVDSVVPVGLKVLGIGEFYLTNRGLAMRGPCGTTGLFTRECLRDVVSSASTHRLLLNIAFVALSSAAFACVLSILTSELSLAVDFHDHESILRRRAAASLENEDDTPALNRGNTMAAILRQVVDMRERQERERGVRRHEEHEQQQQQQVEQEQATSEARQQRQQAAQEQEEQADDSSRDDGDGDVEERRCVVCLSSKQDTAIVPCGHVCLCSGCALVMCEHPREWRRCPICRIYIQDIMPLFYS